jgi:circadian clock protein KaiC
VIPVTSLGLDHNVTNERVSTGIPGLDDMLRGKGVFRGSSLLISGTPGTGKSSVAAHFVNAVCERGQRCLYFAFEESMTQIVRNMHSIGIDLQPWILKGLLRFYASRPTAYGLETHVATMHKLVDEFKPAAVVIDPLTNLINVGSQNEVHSALLRLIDLLKLRQITGFFTSLTHDGNALEKTELGISSIMDTWLLLRDIESSGERNRGLYILKSRGMAHSNQIREFRLTDHGVELTDLYLGPAGVLTGAARESQEMKERAEALVRRGEIERKQRALERKRAALEAQVASLRSSFQAEEEEIHRTIEKSQLAENTLDAGRTGMARLRHAEASVSGAGRSASNLGRDNHEKNFQKAAREKGKKRVRQ